MARKREIQELKTSTGSPTKSLSLPEAAYEEIKKTARDQGKDIADYIIDLHAKSRGALHPELTPPSQGYQSVHKTKLGQIVCADARSYMLNNLSLESIDLIVTSPPYALVYKKDYGNEDADRYLDWFRPFVQGFNRVLKPNASLVIDIGGVWKKGRPTRSLYHFELLIMLCREYGYHLIQEFYWWNPAKLPSPAEWVNVRRIRVKDAVNCIWWLSKSEYPKASNKRVLQPYSRDMERLLEKGYRHKARPSGHNISSKFQIDNGGSIPPNLIALGNNDSNGAYRRYCQESGLVEHPAQFPPGLPAFFIHMLTDPGDRVLDPFGGSCVTGQVAESLARKWCCIELLEDYAKAGKERLRLRNGNGLSTRREPYAIYAPTFDLNPDQTPLDPNGGAPRTNNGRGK